MLTFPAVPSSHNAAGAPVFIFHRFPVETVVTQSPLLLENADAVSGRVPGSPPAHWRQQAQSGPPSHLSLPLPHGLASQGPRLCPEHWPLPLLSGRLWTCPPAGPTSAHAQHRARGEAFVTVPASVSVSEPCDSDSVVLTGMLSVRMWDPGRAVAPARAVIDHCPLPCWAATSGGPHDL